LDRHLIPEYQTWLRALGIGDPTTTETEPKAAASAYWKRAQALWDEARHVRPEEPTRRISTLLADGEISPADARKMMAKHSDREAEKLLHEQRIGLNAGSRMALLRAIQSIHDYTEAGWVGLLRPIASEALDKGDDRVWNLVHAFARWLRSPRNGVYGLAALKVNHNSDADRDLYEFSRPDLYHRWRVEHASDTQRREMARYTVDGLVRVQYFLKNAPTPALRDFDPAWGPGLFGASEALQHIENSKAEQEREFARLASPAAAAPPTTGQKRRRSVAFI